MTQPALSKEQQLANCKLALDIWKTRVDPESVVLHSWTCGSHACFGGHLATWPEFQAMGVKRSEYSGAPRIDGVHFEDDYLFGDNRMFDSRDREEEKEQGIEDLLDYDMVIYRLERRIRELSK